MGKEVQAVGLVEAGTANALAKAGVDSLTAGQQWKRGYQPSPPNRDLVKEIAMDIGKEVVAHIEVMYPQAISATPSTFKLSVRNSIYNEIMAALEVNEEGAIIARLEDRKQFRRRWTAVYRKFRKISPTSPRSRKSSFP